MARITSHSGLSCFYLCYSSCTDLDCQVWCSWEHYLWSRKAVHLNALDWVQLTLGHWSSHNHSLPFTCKWQVGRFHRQLKAALKARTTTPDWFAELPLVVLGIRSSWRVDPGCSPAELVYGSTRRLPVEFSQPLDAKTMEPDSMFLKHLQQTMRTVLPPAPVDHGKTPVYIPSNLASTGFVYVRNGALLLPLQRPYVGPYRIINTNDKFYTLDIKGRSEKVSVDRLKAAIVTPLTTSEHKTVVSLGPQDPPVFSRRGHAPHVVSPGAQVPRTSPKTTSGFAAKSTEPSVHSPSSPTKNHPVVTTRSGRASRLPYKFQWRSFQFCCS